MRLHFYVKEFSESEHFPEVHIFQTAQECRAAMIAEAQAAREAWGSGAWITEDLDGESVTHCLGPGQFLADTVTTLNVQMDNGRTHCFVMDQQDVSLTI